MSDARSFEADYLDEVRRSFRGYKRLADGGLAQLNDPDFFKAPDTESNSAAQLVKHMAGNLRSRWLDFLTTDGEKPDRNRDQEFVLTQADTRTDLMRRWEESFKIVFDTVASLKPEDFVKTVTIRGEPHTILQAINRSLMHTAYHVGQILYVGKHLRGAAWEVLSIPKGKSEEFNSMKPEDRKVKLPNRP
ncbi:MAG TPA: DUF1572 family protein [Candidatus Limnocylindrales bacterium]|nr:DUF1572 family protein [Candidatus Limnocylindrales bacterium]